MADLAEFLLARIAEDEEMAIAVRDYRRKREPLEGDATGGYEWDNSGMVYVAPARVLAECAAKRRILEIHSRDDYYGGCVVDGIHYPVHDGDPVDVDPYPCLTVRLLAQPYADHPDYRPEWGSITSPAGSR